MSEQPKPELANWMRDKYLKYQLEKNDLISLKDFADFLGISRPYLSLILNGEREKISRDFALSIAESLNDYEILDICGYERSARTRLPSEITDKFEAVAELIVKEYEERGITDYDSIEALEIAKQTFKENGFILFWLTK